MKKNESIAYVAYIIAWISTACAVGWAIQITDSAYPLWAMLIPACIEIKSNSNDK